MSEPIKVRVDLVDGIPQNFSIDSGQVELEIRDYDSDNTGKPDHPCERKDEHGQLYFEYKWHGINKDGKKEFGRVF
jgi:hypothetical protein